MSECSSGSLEETLRHTSECRARTMVTLADTDRWCVWLEAIIALVIFIDVMFGSGQRVVASGFLLVSVTLTRIQIAIKGVGEDIYRGFRETKE